MVAHSLARAAYSMSRRRVFDSIPRYIKNYLINLINEMRQKKKVMCSNSYI
jgi:hypothetical protein